MNSSELPRTVCVFLMGVIVGVLVAGRAMENQTPEMKGSNNVEGSIDTYAAADVGSDSDSGGTTGYGGLSGTR